MNATQKSEALRLADKYEVHGFLGDHRFAQELWCRQAATELLRQHARIAELEAQLSAIGAGGVEPMHNREASAAAQTLFPHPVEVIKKVTKPSINWEHVRDEYKFLVRSASGNAWLYIEEPILDEDYWCAEAGVYVNANSYASYIPGNCDWKDSLVKRPD